MQWWYDSTMFSLLFLWLLLCASSSPSTSHQLSAFLLASEHPRLWLSTYCYARMHCTVNTQQHSWDNIWQKGVLQDSTICLHLWMSIMWGLFLSVEIQNWNVHRPGMEAWETNSPDILLLDCKSAVLWGSKLDHSACDTLFGHTVSWYTVLHREMNFLHALPQAVSLGSSLSI